MNSGATTLEQLSTYIGKVLVQVADKANEKTSIQNSNDGVYWTAIHQNSFTRTFK